MKRSTFLLIVLTLILISIGAATSSTFAWLTSSTFVTASLRDMMAISTDGNLYVDWDTSYTEGSYDFGIKGGTNSARGHTYLSDPSTVSSNIVHDVEGTDYDGISFQRFRDCSIDMSTLSPTPYKALTGGDGKINGTYAKVSTSYSADKFSGTYYYAKFGLRFVVKAGTNLAAYHIFMNNASLDLNGSKNNIDSAVRMGIKPYRGTNNTKTEANIYSVWAPNYDTTNVAPEKKKKNGTSISFVSSTTGTSTYSYSANSSDKMNAFSVATEELDYDNTDYSNYIGEVGSTTSRNWITYSGGYYSYIDCDLYFWYEGSDVLCNLSVLQDQAYSIAIGFRAIKDDGAD